SLAASIMPYLANGGLGVHVFFVLSGFLITHLLRREVQKTGAVDLLAFYMRRVLRIFPALYTYLLTLTVLAVLGVITTSPGELVRAGTFFTNYAFLITRESAGGYWFVGHFWTLSLEEQFYLFWPLIILL